MKLKFKADICEALAFVFKEKAQRFDSRYNEEAQELYSKAEHYRWKADRIRSEVSGQLHEWEKSDDK